MTLPLVVKSLPTFSKSSFFPKQIVTPISQQTKPDQSVGGRLVANVQIQSQGFSDPSHAGGQVERRLVHVDFNGSTFNAPTNAINDPDMRGFFVEWIRYKAWLGAADQPNNPGSSPVPADDWFIEQEAPNTTNSTGTVSSSISYGFNESVGVFGDVPTANVGVNMGVSQSYSHSLTDFTFMQQSTDKVLNHFIQMTMCNDGAPYVSAGSLLDFGQNVFFGCQLRPLPALARSNVPFVGQAVWMNSSDRGLVDKLKLWIYIEPHFLFVEGEQRGANNLTHQNIVVGYGQQYGIDIDFGILKT